MAKAMSSLQGGVLVGARPQVALRSRASVRSARPARSGRLLCQAVQTTNTKARHLELRGSGSEPWKSLLPTETNNTIDPELRKLIVTMGELTQVTYDSFVGDTSSRLFGSNRYEPSKLLTSTLLPNSLGRRYKVDGDAATFYMYATEGAYKLSEDSKEGNPSADRIEDPKNKNWIGYIAISEPEDGVRDVAIIFRGTITGGEWKTNVFGDKLTDWVKDKPELGKVHDGFRATYWEEGETDVDSPRATVKKALLALFRKYGTEIGTVTVSGHSLGGALATLGAFDVGLRLQDKTSPTSIRNILKKEGVKIRDDIHVSGITFAAPRVGDPTFKAAMKKIAKVPILRIVNIRDVVPKVPGLASTALTRFLASVGIDTTESRNETVRSVLSGINFLISKIPFLGNWSYEHTAPEWYVDTLAITYVDGADPATNANRPMRPLSGKEVGQKHNMEVYIYLASTQSADKGGKLNRDPILMNKSDFCLEQKWLVETGKPDVIKCWHSPATAEFYNEWKKANS